MLNGGGNMLEIGPTIMPTDDQTEMALPLFGLRYATHVWSLLLSSVPLESNMRDFIGRSTVLLQFKETTAKDGRWQERD